MSASMSHIRYYRVLPWASGLLTLLEGIAKVPNRQVAKTGNSSIFWLSFPSSSFFCQWTVSQASTITDEAITMIQTWKNGINHWVLHSLLSVILTLKLFFSDSQALRCQYLVLYTILLEFVWMTLFIACTPLPRLEAQLSMCLVCCYRERWRWQQPRLGGIT